MFSLKIIQSRVKRDIRTLERIHEDLLRQFDDICERTGYDPYWGGSDKEAEILEKEIRKLNLFIDDMIDEFEAAKDV